MCRIIWKVGRLDRHELGWRLGLGNAADFCDMGIEPAYLNNGGNSVMHLCKATVNADSYSSRWDCNWPFACRGRLPPSFNDWNRTSIEARLLDSIASRSACNGLRMALDTPDWGGKAFGAGLEPFADKPCLVLTYFFCHGLPLDLPPCEPSFDGGSVCRDRLHGVSGSNPLLCA